MLFSSRVLVFASLPVLLGLTTLLGKAENPSPFPTTTSQATVNEGLGFNWVSPNHQWAYAIENGALELVSPGDLLTSYKKIKPSSFIVSNGVFSTDGNFLYVGTWEGNVLLFQADGKELASSPVCSHDGKRVSVLSMAINQQRELLVACKDDRVLLCNATDPNKIVLKKTFVVDVEQPGQGASAIAMPPPGGSFVIASPTKKVTLWKQESTGDYKPAWTHTYPHAVTKVLYSPEGRWLLLSNGEAGSRVVLSDVPTGTQQDVLFTQPPAWEEQIYHFRFVPGEMKVEAVTGEIGGKKKYTFDIRHLYLQEPRQCMNSSVASRE